MKWNAFISYASEDKSFAQRLANALAKQGLNIWFDEFELNIGDSLRRSIDQGLSNSRFGIVILSPSFFAKEWPQKELDALIARESPGEKILLPIWHNISAEQIRNFSPMLADRIAISSDVGLAQVIEKLLRAINLEISPLTRSSKGYVGVNIIIQDEFGQEAERLVASVKDDIKGSELKDAISKELPDLMPQRNNMSYDIFVEPLPNRPLSGALMQEGVTLYIRPKRSEQI